MFLYVVQEFRGKITVFDLVDGNNFWFKFSA